MLLKKLLATVFCACIAFCCLGCDNEPKYSAGHLTTAESISSREWQKRERTELPGYFKVNVQAKINEAKKLYEANKKDKDIFVFFSDYHIEENQGFSPLLIKEINKALPISMVVFGGDIYDKGPTKDECLEKIKAFRQRFSFCEDKWQEVLGNHEYNTAQNNKKEHPEAFMDNELLKEKLLGKQLTAFAHSEYGDYWLDKGDMRYFFLGATFNQKILPGQYTWLFEELTKVPDGKTVLLFSHIGCGHGPLLGKVDKPFAPVTQALGALKAGKNFTWQGVTYNYAGKKVTVAGCLTGHVHRDNLIEDNGITVAAICTDTLRYVPEKKMNRKPGTLSEQVIDIVVIDKAQHEVQMVRVGHGKNRSFKY